APVRCGGVQLGALVEEVGGLAEDAEAMGESGGNPQLARNLLGELQAHPPSEAGRAAADVDRDIEDLSPEDLDQLALPFGLLEMQSAQGAPDRAGVVVLDEGTAHARLGIPRFLEALVEESPRIAEDLRLDDQHLRQLGGNDLHPMAPRCSRRSSR